MGGTSFLPAPVTVDGSQSEEAPSEMMGEEPQAPETSNTKRLSTFLTSWNSNRDLVQQTSELQQEKQQLVQQTQELREINQTYELKLDSTRQIIQQYEMPTDVKQNLLKSLQIKPQINNLNNLPQMNNFNP